MCLQVRAHHPPQTPLGQRRGGNQLDGGCWSQESVVKCLTGQHGSFVGGRHRGKASRPDGCACTHQPDEGSLDTWCKREKPPGLVKL